MNQFVNSRCLRCRPYLVYKLHRKPSSATEVTSYDHSLPTLILNIPSSASVLSILPSFMWIIQCIDKVTLREEYGQFLSVQHSPKGTHVHILSQPATAEERSTCATYWCEFQLSAGGHLIGVEGLHPATVIRHMCYNTN